MVLDAKSMTVEEFYQFGLSKPTYRYLPDKLGEKPLVHVIKHISKLIHVLNAHTTRTTTSMPEARQDLPSEGLESIYCNHCHTHLPIRRLQPAITKAPGLSTKTSQYVTQPLQYCNCNLSACLVDHRGNLRAYGNSLSLVNYLHGHPLHHLLAIQPQLEVSRQLLDGKKPRYERLVAPRYLWETNFIDLSYLTEAQSNIVLPVPDTLYRHRYLQTYAYNHQIAILTGTQLILPSGYSIPLRHPLLDSLKEPIARPPYLNDTPNMTRGTILRGIKRTLSHLLATNQLVTELNRNISTSLNLPLVEPKLYSHQTIGYLQIARYQRPEPVVHRGKYYITPAASKTITATRVLARRILRDLLNGKSIPNLLKSVPFRPFAKIPPGLIFMSLKPTPINPHIYKGRGAKLL